MQTVVREIALLSLFLAASAALELGNSNQTAWAAKGAVRAAPSKSRLSATEEGGRLYKAGDFRGAIQQFQKAYQQHENPDYACYYIAMAYLGLKDRAHAKQYFDFINLNFPESDYAAKAISQIMSLKLNEPDSSAPAPHVATTGAVKSAATSKTDEPIDVVLPLTHYDREVIVVAQINGVPLRMLFDTGAAATFATSSSLAEAGIDLRTKRGGPRVHGVGGETDTGSVDVDLSVGSLTKRVTLFVQDDEVQRRNQGEHTLLHVPLLGQDFFGEYAIELDFAHQKIHLRTPQEPGKAKKDPTAIPFTRAGNHIMVRPQINGRECEMCLDTGAQMVAFTDRQFSGFGFSRPTHAARAHAVGVGGMHSAYSFYLDKVKLGPIEKEDVVAGIDLNGAIDFPLLGMSFFEGEHLIIEPKLKQIRFIDD